MTRGYGTIDRLSGRPPPGCSGRCPAGAVSQRDQQPRSSKAGAQVALRPFERPQTSSNSGLSALRGTECRTSRGLDRRWTLRRSAIGGADAIFRGGLRQPPLDGAPSPLAIKMRSLYARLRRRSPPDGCYPPRGLEGRENPVSTRSRAYPRLLGQTGLPLGAGNCLENMILLTIQGRSVTFSENNTYLMYERPTTARSPPDCGYWIVYGYQVDGDHIGP